MWRYCLAPGLARVRPHPDIDSRAAMVVVALLVTTDGGLMLAAPLATTDAGLMPAALLGTAGTNAARAIAATAATAGAFGHGWRWTESD
jgi:hypothetical protein